MTRLIAVILFCAGIFCLAAEPPVGQLHAQVPFTGAGLGKPSGGGGAFTGIADVYTGTVAHFGNRAASSARRGNKLLNVCDAATGLVCADWSSDASTGLIVPTTIGGSSCGSITCEVAIAYDDSGVNACNSGTTVCDVNAAHGSRPTVTLSGINSLPVIVCGGHTLTNSSPGAAVSQPFTESIVAARTGGAGANSVVLAGQQSGLVGFDVSSGVMLGYGGTILDTSSGLTESSFHSLQFTANGVSNSVVQGDGQAPVTGNGGTLAITNGTGFFLCNDQFGDSLTGSIAEAWIGSGDQHTTFGAAHTNQSTAYGTP